MTRAEQSALGMTAFASLALLIGLVGLNIWLTIQPEPPLKPLVDEWSISVLNDVLDPTEPIDLEGLFICSDEARAENPTAQFSSAVREAGIGGWTVARIQSPAVPLGELCGITEATPFQYPPVTDVARVAVAGDIAHIRITVEAVSPGWEPFTVESNDVTVSSVEPLDG